MITRTAITIFYDVENMVLDIGASSIPDFFLKMLSLHSIFVFANSLDNTKLIYPPQTTSCIGYGPKNIGINLCNLNLIIACVTSIAC